MGGFYTPNPNFVKELSADPEVTATVAEAAETARRNAIALAPYKEGDYREGIKVLIEGGKVTLAGTHWTSHFIEWGSVNNPAFAPLRRGIRAAGLRLQEGR